MKLDIREKKVLCVYGCPDYNNTVTRLKWLVSLTVDQEAKRWLLVLARKMETEGSVIYVLDKSRLSIRLVPRYSEERRAAARDYAKEHGFQPVKAIQDIA